MAEPRLCSIPNCGKPRFRRGWCSAHYTRWRSHDDPLAGRTFRGEPLRFLKEKVLICATDDACLIWPYGRNDKGYAQAWIDGRLRLVSRVVCDHTHGPPPSPKHEAAHSCGRGHLGCVASSHLSWKTSSENQADKIIHGTTNRGKKHKDAKLTENNVRAIRSLRGVLSFVQIASRFGVSKGAVADIFAERSWAWLD